jgi:hypothetical protein
MFVDGIRIFAKDCGIYSTVVNLQLNMFAKLFYLKQNGVKYC